MESNTFRISFYSLFEKIFLNRHYESFKILKKVFIRQCELQDGQFQNEKEVVLKEKPDKDAINTPHNPEATYKKKDTRKTEDPLDL